MTSIDYQAMIGALRAEVEDSKREIAGLKKENAELKRNLEKMKGREMVDSITPTYITEGSFGTISCFPLQTLVYKTTILGDQANRIKLEHEFRIYCEVHDLTNALNTTPDDSKYREDIVFISPRPRQLYDPFTRTVKLPGMETSPPSSSWDVFDKPSMSLQLIPSIPSLVAQAYRSEMFSPDLARTTSIANIRLLRLYLGRELPTHIQELQPGLRSDLALDVGRYNRLAEALSLEGEAILPPLTDVAWAMGKILAMLHFGVGIDGMDVELVLGGNQNHGLQCYILDYNQCQRWLVPRPIDNLGSGKITIANDEDLLEGAIRLARRIGNCEHYYTKPSHPLYTHFKFAYGYTVSDLVSGEYCEKPTRLLGKEDHLAFDRDAEAVIAAGKAFLAEYEKVGQETAERKAITEARGREETAGS